MSRRPPLPPVGRLVKAQSRMAPGGRVWSEAPIPRKHMPRVAAAGEPPVLTYSGSYRIGAGIGGAWAGFNLYLNPPYESPPLGAAAVFTMLPPESSVWPDADPVIVYSMRKDPGTFVTTVVDTFTVSAGSPSSAHVVSSTPDVWYQVNLGAGSAGAARWTLWTDAYEWPATEQTFALVTA